MAKTCGLPILCGHSGHLDDFDDKAEGDGEGGEDDEQGEEGDEVGADARALLAAWIFCG